jgi:hypothetical protein
MLVDTIQAQLMRLQVHPVNLGVTTKDDQVIALRGSLLRYWNTPETVDGTWFLEALRRLPDDAGPAVVMNALFATIDNEKPPSEV